MVGLFWWLLLLGLSFDAVLQDVVIRVLGVGGCITSVGFSCDCFGRWLGDGWFVWFIVCGLDLLLGFVSLVLVYCDLDFVGLLWFLVLVD